MASAIEVLTIKLGSLNFTFRMSTHKSQHRVGKNRHV